MSDPATKTPTPKQQNPIVQLTDLRSITRTPNVTRTVVTLDRLDNEREFEWLVFGEGHLDSPNENTGICMLKGYLVAGATDMEHDSAYAVTLPLIGVRYKYVWYHSTHVQAWVATDPYMFRVPRAGYNPLTKAAGATRCLGKKYCKRGEPHTIVERFTPEFDEKLWRAVAGKRVEIIFRVLDLEARAADNKRLKSRTSK